MPEQGGGGGGLMADVEKVPAWVWLGGLAAGAIFFIFRRNSGASTSNLSSAPSALPAASGPTPYTDASGNTWYPPGWIPGSSVPPAGTTPPPPPPGPTPITTQPGPTPPLPPKSPPPIWPTDPGPGLGPGAPPPTLAAVPSWWPSGAAWTLPAYLSPQTVAAGNLPYGTNTVGPGVFTLPLGWFPMGSGFTTDPTQSTGLGGYIVLPTGQLQYNHPPATVSGGMAANLQAHNAAQQNMLASPAANIATAQASRAALVGQALNSHTGPGQPPGARVPQEIVVGAPGRLPPGWNPGLNPPPPGWNPGPITPPPPPPVTYGVTGPPAVGKLG